MRKTPIGIVAVVVVTTAALGASPRPQGDQGRNKLEGTWEHTFENEPRLRQIKVINQDHFVWVTYFYCIRYNISRFFSGGRMLRERW